jgi:hypothetical protein
MDPNARYGMQQGSQGMGQGPQGAGNGVLGALMGGIPTPAAQAMQGGASPPGVTPEQLQMLMQILPALLAQLSQAGPTQAAPKPSGGQNGPGRTPQGK